MLYHFRYLRLIPGSNAEQFSQEKQVPKYSENVNMKIGRNQVFQMMHGKIKTGIGPICVDKRYQNVKTIEVQYMYGMFKLDARPMLSYKPKLF